MYSSCFEYRPNRTTGDHAGTGRGGLKHNFASAEFSVYFVRDTGFGNGNLTHILTGIFNPLANSIRNLVSFAKTMTNLTLAVANHTDSAETETATTLNNLGGPINENNLFYKLITSFIILKV
jgi:hypothetical protein